MIRVRDPKRLRKLLSKPEPAACGRCGAQPPGLVTVLDVRAGPMREHFPAGLALCHECSVRFAAWLASGRRRRRQTETNP